MLFDLATAIWEDGSLQRVGWWIQLTGILGLAGTTVTGLIAKGRVAILPEARSTLESHEQIAFALVSLATILILWKISSRLRLPEKGRWVYLSLNAGLVVLLWIGASYGGELVYTFGVGVHGR